MGNPVSDSYGKLTDAFNSVTTSTTVPRMPAAPKEKNLGPVTTRRAVNRKKAYQSGKSKSIARGKKRRR